MIETEFGQGVTGKDENRPGKLRGDDLIQGEKVRRERIKRSKSLEMQEVRELGRKKDGEEVGFRGL